MKKGKIIFSAILVLFVVATIAGWGVAIYQYNEIKNRDDKIAKLTEENEKLDKQIEDITVVDDPYADFIKVEGWDVMFSYPDGVTKVKMETGKDGDGSLLIKSIEKDGKTYDVDICGGASQYSDSEFSIGKIVRWKNSGSHQEGAEDPSKDMTKYTMIYRTNNYSYYYNYNVQQGCKTGDDNASYQEARQIASDIAYGIHIKEE